MIETVEHTMKKLPPVRGKVAGVAAVIGFLFGGVGLAIYFRNIVDLFFPVTVAIAVTFVAGADIGWLAGALLAAMYGYFRVHFSHTSDLPERAQSR